MYDRKCWLGVVLENCFGKGDFQIQFMHPYGPAKLSTGTETQIHA